MPYQASVFETLLKALPRQTFERLVARHNSDYRHRRLSSWSHLVSMVYAQMSGAQSLRELEGSLNSHGNLFYHLGLGAVRRSTLSDANAKRSAALFEDVFELLLGSLQGQLKRQMGQGTEVLRLLDATLLPLPRAHARWVKSWNGMRAAKAQVVYDPVADTPVYCALSSARTNDVHGARALPLEPGATYVFDRGYYDFAWWAKLSAQGCRFVTRSKKNMKMTVLEERAAIGPAILSDQTIQLRQRASNGRKNPYQEPLRQIIVARDKRQPLRILTNDLKAPAEEIAELYKLRWQIELFFKWVKQNLRIKRFLGASQNAVRIQIATAFIAYILVRLASAKAPHEISMQALTRLLRANLTHRKAWSTLFEPPPNRTRKPRQNPQIAWNF